MRNNMPKGQIGLLLLVIMGVILALVMSVATRSLSDSVLSRQERESGMAFSVAETGIELAMKSLGQGEIPEGLVSLPKTLDIVTGEYKVSPNTSYGIYVKEGETAHLDATGFSGALSIYWTKKSDKTENLTTCSEGSGMAPAAIEVNLIKGTSINRSYFNPYSCALMSGNISPTSDGGVIYRSTSQVNVPVGTEYVRIKPIYAGATIEVAGTNLKNQLYLIESKAKTTDVQKEIEVKRGLDAPGSIFDFAVFSDDSIVK